jgi:Flp pilus assembly protein CpaB
MPSRSHPSLTGRLRDRIGAVRRAVLRRRRLLAVLCTALAVAAGVRAAAPPAPDTVALLVADRALPAGAVVAAADLRSVELPPDAVPDGALDDPVGTTLAAPLGRGEPVTEARVVGPGLTTAAPDTVPLPVRLSDAGQAGLLTVGDRIDLLATDPQQGTTVLAAGDVPVLALPEPDARAGSGPGGALTGRLVVLGVPDALVNDVTEVSVTRFVTFAWSGH